ncbi:pentatricopeptide repeat-containing protein At5g48910-like [Panicum hallii]|jgi:pentatricopeptide repeat protein|uniref:pentatricopeptide repeat-containing protein At5g48910-like n=1 Tax=Panicum hallii TaxID=206008 RepID=UPI000DF4E479|nr:pentatricopeptide repeat-containing protein At5g48910-like [Panicum hallii]XP_025800414.1 pentatricopeptide repeat-containing protein At5g48910-like [Panicum hallii]XP_025800415.1 pentatricopeptide repeat-containing protein At5g48910-like [Panicum hallii]
MRARRGAAAAARPEHLAARLVKSASPDALLVTTAMRGYLRACLPLQALLLLRSLLPRAPRLLGNSFSLSIALQATAAVSGSVLSTLGRGLGAASLHACALKSGFAAADLFVRTALVEAYAKAGRADLARAAFDEAPRRDVFLTNVMLAAYVARGEVAEARKVFDGMRDRDLVSWNTMIHGYAVKGEVSMAREIFDGMEDRDDFSWSSMMSAYAKGRRSKEALELWQEMRAAYVSPDRITMVSVLSACGDMGALAVGAEVHQFVESNGIEVDVKLGTALIDMYAKCGDIENSLRVFHSMPAKDVLTWSSMIIGLANHGLGHDALSLFSRMISQGLQPNDITFIGVLIACTHLGLVSDGKKYFSSMSVVHGVAPKVEHFGCMVNLLGRSGHIEEARQLIRDMPFEPDAVIWRALLGACRIYKNVEVAEEAMAKLRVLDPHADGHYVLLSNIYAQANSWEGVAEMRTMLRRENIQRIPGRSSIEWQNTIHEFVSGDRSHPRSKEIYEILEEMMDRLRQAGYKPMTGLVLQDIDEQSKERALAEHSEKLAIAFGLLTTPARSTLRITKNLRACEDCHSAIKLISLVYDRKLIIRDRNRFHHFSEGQCSCKDYW